MSTNPRLIFFDDSKARTFEPFATSRPLCEMRAGAVTVRERWCFLLGSSDCGFISSHWLAAFREGQSAKSLLEGDIVKAGDWLINSRALPALSQRNNQELLTSATSVIVLNGTIAAVKVTQDTPVAAIEDITIDATATRSSATNLSLNGTWLNNVWDLIGQLDVLLNDDIEAIATNGTFKRLTSAPSDQLHIIGGHAVYVEDGAVVEPMVVIDTSAGSVMLRKGARIQAFTRVVGPCYIGEHSSVMGDKIANCSIGPVCRVHGEVSTSIFFGYSNKGHDGFVGHSVVGRWVNLGAGTITSNLKNTYGSVALWTPQGVVNTGLQFLGTLFGDHAKTGIGLRLTTGCVLGAGSNVYDAMPPKYVPPFSWGGSASTQLSGVSYERFEHDRFVRTAERMMSRRGIEADSGTREYLSTMHKHATS